MTFRKTSLYSYSWPFIRGTDNHFQLKLYRLCYKTAQYGKCDQMWRLSNIPLYLSTSIQNRAAKTAEGNGGGPSWGGMLLISSLIFFLPSCANGLKCAVLKERLPADVPWCHGPGSSPAPHLSPPCANGESADGKERVHPPSRLPAHLPASLPLHQGGSRRVMGALALGIIVGLRWWSSTLSMVGPFSNECVPSNASAESLNKPWGLSQLSRLKYWRVHNYIKEPVD